MPNICLVLEYNGGAFHGWQMQDNATSVQSELQQTLQTVLRRPVGPLYGAGRTDAGVHARGQVVNFYLDDVPDLDRMKLAVSSILRGKLAVLSAKIVPDGFNSRSDAVAKQYSYTILQRSVPAALDHGRVWRISTALDVERMRKEASLLVGRHDFTSFCAVCSMPKSAIREIFESELIINGPYLTYRVVGEGFLRYMVRIIVGTLVGFGDGSLTAESILSVIAAKDRNVAGVTAPPEGLCLDWVKYCDD